MADSMRPGPKAFHGAQKTKTPPGRGFLVTPAQAGANLQICAPAFAGV
jgi:hypothetical protein